MLDEIRTALLAAGWRWEPPGWAKQPVLTNAPAGQQLCIRCGCWCSLETFRQQEDVCRRCINARAAGRAT